MLFVMPNQQCLSIEGKNSEGKLIATRVYKTKAWHILFVGKAMHVYYEFKIYRQTLTSSVQTISKKVFRLQLASCSAH